MRLILVNSLFALGFIGVLVSTHIPLSEHTVGHRVQFITIHDGALRPVLPIELRVERESGEPPTTLLTCDIAAREHVVTDGGEEKAATETVLRCGSRTFVVRQIIFTESGR